MPAAFIISLVKQPLVCAHSLYVYYIIEYMCARPIRTRQNYNACFPMKINLKKKMFQRQKP